MKMDYKAIVESLEINKVEKLLYSLGAKNVVDAGEFLITNTICHNADNGSMKLYFYKDTKLFVCYTHCGNMSIFKFLKHYYEARGIEYDWYTDVFQVIKQCTIDPDDLNRRTHLQYTPIRDKYSPKLPLRKLESYPKGILEVFSKYYPIEWTKDGITESVMDKYNILYSSTQNKIIIPQFHYNGNLVGIRGRALNQWEIDNVGKYMPVLIEGNWYSHPLSLTLYGLDKNAENIKESGICYIFEAEKSVMQMESFNMKNCSVAICGSNLNKYQIRLLTKTCHPKEIVLCYDNEELPGEQVYFNKLYTTTQKYKNYANFSFVYDREQMTGRKDSPTDNGEEVFRELISKRVIV